VSINYLKATNFMFLGGLILALAIEHSGLHRRLALRIMLLVGTSPRLILLGFMITTGKSSVPIKSVNITGCASPMSKQVYII
jgi:sodium-dependent dicarboxylate transporter 2/3/5